MVYLHMFTFLFGFFVKSLESVKLNRTFASGNYKGYVVIQADFLIAFIPFVNFYDFYLEIQPIFNIAKYFYCAHLKCSKIPIMGHRMVLISRYLFGFLCALNIQ